MQAISRRASQTLELNTQASFRARILEQPEADAGDCSRNIGRTGGNFQYRLRIVNRLLVHWRQVAAAAKAPWFWLNQSRLCLLF
jgi:hypothetical protein